MKVLTVIPTRYELDRLRALATSLVSNIDEMLVLDNGHVPPITHAAVPEIHIRDTRGMGIYAQWNLGWQTARERGFDAVALLNDDIRLLPGSLAMMADGLATPGVGVVYPDWPLPLSAGLPAKVELQHTRGTVSTGGMTGFCFMFRTNLPVPPFDESYGWWYGDDAFERSVREAGFQVAKIVGLPCEHESDSEANDWARRPELRAIAEQDRVRWEAAR